MKPGSWWEKPLWSCRQTVDDSRMFCEATEARHGTWFLQMSTPFPCCLTIEARAEGPVGMKEAVTGGEEIAFEPSDERVLGEHLHHPPVAGQLAAVAVLG